MRTPVRALSAVAVVLALTTATACGGDDDTTTRGTSAQASATPTVVETPKTWPPKGSSGELVEYPYVYGVSWQAPRAWKFERSDDEDGAYQLFIWSERVKRGGGTMSVSVQNDRQTAEEWVALITGGVRGVTELSREKVSVPGYGQGIHLRQRVDKGGYTIDKLVVTSIDGVLLELTVNTPKGKDTDLAEQIIASVKRGDG